jgi:hypothetical protein
MGAGTCGKKRQEGTAHTDEVARLLRRGNPWRAKPQERYRGEIDPEGAGRRKPAGG